LTIFFGDNQFLGVNHSGGRSNEYFAAYADKNKVLRTLNDALDSGISDFSFTVSDRTVGAYLEFIKTNPEVNLHPCFPYAQFVNNKLTQKGTLGYSLELAKKAGFLSILKSLNHYFLFKESTELMKVITTVFTSEIPSKNLKSLSLLNVFVDLLIGAGRWDILIGFIQACRELEVEANFYTMNPTRLMETLWANGRNADVRITFNFNQKGFRMNPNQDIVMETCKRFEGHKITAMSLFSGGDNQAFKFVENKSYIESVLFGSSSKSRIINNVNKFRALGF
jgi:hypothetical protein